MIQGSFFISDKFVVKRWSGGCFVLSHKNFFSKLLTINLYFNNYKSVL